MLATTLSVDNTVGNSTGPTDLIGFDMTSPLSIQLTPVGVTAADAVAFYASNLATGLSTAAPVAAHGILIGTIGPAAVQSNAGGNPVPAPPSANGQGLDVISAPIPARYLYAVRLAGSTASLVAAVVGQASEATNIQTGTGTLASGTLSITGVVLSPSSKIYLTMRDPGAGVITGMAALDAPVASRNTSAGSFVVNAIDDSKATIGTAVCTFDWVIVG